MKQTVIRLLLFTLFLLLFHFVVKKADWPLAAVYAFFAAWILEGMVNQYLTK